MKWLVRHFLTLTFDSEMFTARGQWATVAISLCALFIPAGMILLTPPPPGMDAQLLLHTRVDAIIGILALLAWPSLIASRRDYLALAGLPVSSRQIAMARFAATAMLGTGATLVLVTPLSLGKPAQLAQLAGSTAATFFVLVAVQGALVHLVPPRFFARVSTVVQAALLVAAAIAGMATWSDAPWPVPYRRLAAAAPLAFVAAFALCVLGHARQRVLLLEAPDGTGRQGSRWYVNLWSRDPRRRAILHFVAAVAEHSGVQRMVLAGYGAGGVAILINVALAIRAATHQQLLEVVALYWPTALGVIAIAALRHAFLMPAELRANWLFQLTETQGRQQWMSAVERFVIGCAIVPLHTAMFALALTALEFPMAVRVTVLQTLVSLAVFELVFQSWQQLPFACSYVPGRTTLMHGLAAWLLILGLIAPMVAFTLAFAAADPLRFLVALPACGALWWRLRGQRREGWGESPLIYEDTMGLISIGAGSESPVQQYAQRQENPEPATVRLSRTVAQAFPDSRHKEDFVQLTEDSLRRGRSRRLLLDLLLRLPVEHASDVAKDIRYGWRSLVASPGFTLCALFSLGLGICIATCAISEVNGIAFREVPQVARAKELVATQLPVSYPLYERFHAQSELFSQTAGWIAPVPLDVVLNNRTQRVWAHLVTPSYFATFGIRPALGGLFDSSWETPDRPPAVVLSDRFWRERCGADAAIVGRTLRINGRPAMVVGVTQAGFSGASPVFFAADLFVPITTEPTFAPELSRGRNGVRNDPLAAIVRFTARLRAGASQSRAESVLDAVARQFDRDQGVTGVSTRIRRITLVDGGKSIPLRKQDVPLFGTALSIIAGLVMLIACSSVANMKLAHAAARRREIAVRLALGASRYRIVRQLLVESLLLTGAAGLAGFVTSVWLMNSMSHQRLPLPIPVAYDLAPDLRVLVFTTLMTLATGILFGLAPALQAMRTDLIGALKQGGDVRLGQHRRLNVRNLLIVTQVACSLTLMVVLGLFSAGIQTTLGVQQGFNPAHLYMLSLDPVRDGYRPAQAAAFLEKTLERVQGLPSVNAAALTESVPVAMVMSTVPVTRPGDNRRLDRAVKHVVGKDYFATIGVSILRGRSFSRAEETGESATVVVSAALASQYFPGEDPIGRRIEIGNSDPAASRMLPGTYDYRVVSPGGPVQTAMIVGVVGDVADGLVVQKPRPTIYLPLRAVDYAQPSAAGITLIVRGVPGNDVIAQVRREIARLDTNVTTFRAVSMRDHVEEFMTMLRVASWTYGLIGFFGYVLSAIGLAGVTAYAVQQRRRELGIRMALGATAGRVVALVMKDGAILVAAGTALGLLGALAGSRGLAAFNGEVRVTSVDAGDPLVIGGCTLVVAVSALVACYLPARKSARIDPAVTLRQE